jgi:predicted TIM-barrel fold metal-dependent hydrolase
MKVIPTIDAHHHIWRLNDLAWLSGPQVPRIFGPYQPICRDYTIDEYCQDIAGCNCGPTMNRYTGNSGA